MILPGSLRVHNILVCGLPRIKFVVNVNITMPMAFRGHVVHA